MKKLVSVLMCACLVVSASACGKKGATRATADIEIIAPEAVVTLEMAREATGTDMVMSPDTDYDGVARTVTYVSQTPGDADPVSVRIEQFSDSLSTDQVWNDYEMNRIRRSDSEIVTEPDIGKDCYIAYPYICVYDRGCYIKIMAGSGNSQVQKDTLINLASQAVKVIENTISEEDEENGRGNVIK
ncbi:MAG: hypothetical protein J1G06_03950 [Oscillospiraceae bacterium]|nr:hypothetical protein [Oscillospiraceae bacterium]